MGFPLDCEGFEVGFFARSRKLLDGYTVDGPSGYPLEQTRMYLQGDVAVRHRFLNPNKLLEAVTRWDDWIYHDVSVRKCIDRSERIQDYTAEMTGSSSGGTMISGSSVSEINARLALEEDKLNQDQEPLLLPDFPTAYAEKPASSKLIFLYEVVSRPGFCTSINNRVLRPPNRSIGTLDLELFTRILGTTQTHLPTSIEFGYPVKIGFREV